MADPGYTLVYDVSQEGLWNYAISQGGFFFLAAVGGIAVFVYAIRKRRRDLILFMLLWLTLWIGIGGAGSWNVAHQRYQCIQWLRYGDYEVVEGAVSNFRPMPYSGHSLESFSVNGVRFDYSDYDLSRGSFNNTRSHGGPIMEGLQVRIANHNGRILKLEVHK